MFTYLERLCGQGYKIWLRDFGGFLYADLTIINVSPQILRVLWNGQEFVLNPATLTAGGAMPVPGMLLGVRPQ